MKHSQDVQDIIDSWQQYKRRHSKQIKVVKDYAATRSFGRGYVCFALIVLVASTIFWSLLSAHLQQYNADELTHGYLFNSGTSFQQAVFPSQRTLLLKWPLFYILGIMHNSATSFALITVSLSLVTVGFLVVLMYKIERRPLLFGTLCLALASCLLLVPSQIYADQAIPVSIAAISTRNIEYGLFIACLGLLARMPSIRTYRFWLAVLGLTILLVSDRLFLVITLGGALLATMAFGLQRRWKLVTLSVNWLLAGGLAFIATASVIWFINIGEFTTLLNQPNGASLVITHGFKSTGLAIVFAITGILANFGANPGFNATILSKLPTEAKHQMLSVSGVSYLINAFIFGYGLYICYRILTASFRAKRTKNINPSTVFRLTIMLIWSSLAAIVTFIAVNHQYAVDSRLLAIVLFTIFIALTTYFSRQRVRFQSLVFANVVLVTAIGCAIPGVLHNYDQQLAAFKPTLTRNQQVAQTLASHDVAALLGDYQRVIPIKAAAGNNLNVIPLQACTSYKTTNISKAWRTNLTKHSFAYLASLDTSSASFKGCGVQQIEKAYGRPNASSVISGSVSNPTELVLFYDGGIHRSAPTASANKPTATIVPVSLSDLPYTACPVPTDMNIVAHEDDDLLFMNPAIQHDIAAGRCVRTIYLTSGDAGHSRSYWLAREQGSEAAYSLMAGLKTIWINRIVKLPDGQYITVASPQGIASISLIFMHLPDGNLAGQGFTTSQNQSLAELLDGKISFIHSVDNQSSYTSKSLIAGLTSLMHIYQPAVIRTQSSYQSPQVGDHSDHTTTGRYATQAYNQYEQEQYDNQVTIPLNYYVGYPIREMPSNISSQDASAKSAIFLAYVAHDSSVCSNIANCNLGEAYNAYLSREYESAN